MWTGRPGTGDTLDFVFVVINGLFEDADADEPPSLSFSVKRQYGQILSKFRAMYTVGYSLSVGALILALGILVTFR